MLKNVFFDLDGTLLPMDQDLFTKTYLERLAKWMVPYGYEPKALVRGIWKATYDVIKNDGSATNDEVFWNSFDKLMGFNARRDEEHFNEYYLKVFPTVKEVCGFNPAAAELVHGLRAEGMKVVLATNPIFPSVATEERIRWTGLTVEDFEFFTAHENSRHCKPNPDYYRDCLERAGAKAEESLMVGNDVSDDMPAASLGMKVFLLTDCLINHKNEDISKYPHGGFEELKNYIAELKK